jgi:hypothetical protein
MTETQGGLPPITSAELDWIADLDNPYLFHAEFEGVRWSLRVNDFPDEVMFTLIVAGEVVAEFDDRPPGWHMRRSES